VTTTHNINSTVQRHRSDFLQMIDTLNQKDLLLGAVAGSRLGKGMGLWKHAFQRPSRLFGVSS
jgi:hypothetical protein